MSLTPARTAPPPDLEVGPTQVQRWIDGLPLNITFESGRKLLAHLSAVNRSVLEAEARRRIVDAHWDAASRVLDDLAAIYETAPPPLGPGPRAALGLARQLRTELALGYRIALSEYNGALFGGRKLQATLLHRAMRCASERLYGAYRSYTPVPPETWSELHALYLEAERLGLARERGERAEAGSVADMYTDALLLSLTDPYRLAHGDADNVLALLHECRGLATLGREIPGTTPGGHFVSPCDTDRPPKPSLGSRDDGGGPNWRLLDANPVVDHLRVRPAGGPAAQATLVAKLLKLWGDPPKRAARRDPGQATVAISMGIDGVGRFVALQSRVDLAREDEMLRSGITMPLAPLPLDAADEPIPVFEWDVVNQSEGGLRVRRLGPTEQPIAVGEVAGIKLHGKPRWAIGVVRWITVYEDGGMEFGLQYLAPMARAVAVHAWGAPSGTGLLLADSDEQASALLAPPNTFSHQRELELEDDGDACVVRAEAVVEVTHHFELFTVKAP